MRSYSPLSSSIPSNLIPPPLTADLSALHLLTYRCLTSPDVAVQLPDKKSIIMYVTSLFAVLPKDVSMEAIREVETLPRKFKVEAEDSGKGLCAQVNTQHSLVCDSCYSM